MPFGDVAVVGMTAASSGGYWVATADGGVWSYGAPFIGSMGTTPFNSSIVGSASTPDPGGYWLVASDGGVFAFGEAKFFGSVPGALPPGVSLNEPVGHRLDSRWQGLLDGGEWRRNLLVRRRAYLGLHRRYPSEQARGGDGREPTRPATGSSPRTAAFSRSTPPSTGRSAASISCLRSPEWPSHPTPSATGWWPARAACSPSATPRSGDPGVTS